MTETVRLGIVGLGWWGGVLTEAARSSGVAEVVACFARSEQTRTSFAAAHGCRALDDLDAILEDPAIEGMLFATPHSTHVEMVERSAAAGKHAFVEKPLALTVSDAKRASAAAERAGIVLQVGHNRRRQPANRRIKAMIEAGDLGSVVQLEGVHNAAGGFKPGLPEWRRDPAECPNGGMTGLGVHTVDTFNYFVGAAKRVAAFSVRPHGFLPLDEATTVAIEYEAGPLGSINTSYFSAPVVSLGVYGTEASAWNEHDGARLLTQARVDTTPTENPVDAIDTVADELREFATCIRQAAVPETGAAEGVEVAAVLEAIGRSVASRCAVNLADVR